MMHVRFAVVVSILALTLTACTSLPGKTRVEGTLAFQTKQQLKPVALSLDKSHRCPSYSVINTDITSTHRLRYKVDPSWTETWTVNVCGAEWTIPIRFTQHTNGKTSIFISKSGIKRYTENGLQKTDSLTPMGELLQRAEQNDTKAQVELGDRYAGRDNNNEAYKWFTHAAKEQNAGAQYRLGDMYYNGNGVPKNYGIAVGWYNKAAAQGHKGAAFSLGYLYEKGIGVRQNASKSLSYYKQAATQGDPRAQYAVAQAYQQGNAVQKNDKVALGWFMKAANQHLPEAEYSVGTFYASGTRVAKNYKEAEKWYLRAAEQRYAEAQFSLGSLYTAGINGAPDYTKAYQWVYIASRQSSDPKYNQMLDILAKEMQPAQIATAKQLANDWVRKH